MRRDQRQTGSARVAKPTKMELVRAARAAAGPVKPGPFPWDPSMPATRTPSGRELRRSFGTKFSTQKG
jgi:hypothetical protein